MTSITRQRPFQIGVSLGAARAPAQCSSASRSAYTGPQGNRSPMVPGQSLVTPSAQTTAHTEASAARTASCATLMEVVGGANTLLVIRHRDHGEFAAAVALELVVEPATVQICYPANVSSRAAAHSTCRLARMARPFSIHFSAPSDLPSDKSHGTAKFQNQGRRQLMGRIHPSWHRGCQHGGP